MKYIKYLLLGILVFALAVLVLMYKSPIKSVQLLRVMSGSMNPAVKTGTVLIIKKIPFSDIQKGEIISYIANDGRNITHRVVEKKTTNGKSVLITKGDANKTSDVDPVTETQVQGKAVFAIPWLGYLSVWMKTPKGFIFLVVIPALLIIGGELWTIKNEYKKMIIEKIRKEKNENI